jgi:hypothetical protein
MELRWDFTLRELQKQLNGLAERALFSDLCLRLSAPLRNERRGCPSRLNFARGNACIANHSKGAI